MKYPDTEKYRDTVEGGWVGTGVKKQKKNPTFSLGKERLCYIPAQPVKAAIMQHHLHH